MLLAYLIAWSVVLEFCWTYWVLNKFYTYVTLFVLNLKNLCIFACSTFTQLGCKLVSMQHFLHLCFLASGYFTRVSLINKKAWIDGTAFMMVVSAGAYYNEIDSLGMISWRDCSGLCKEVTVCVYLLKGVHWIMRRGYPALTTNQLQF
jgi:hypothetical protein